MKKKILMSLTIGFTVLSITPTLAGQWKLDSKGYWYQNDDGSYPASMWKNIDGKWYYFKSNGYMNTSWIKVNDQWYYCELSGDMRTEELSTDVMTFRFNTDGSCSNFYENKTPSLQAGWSNYSTSSISTLANALSKGNIVYYQGQYWATPDYVNLLENVNVVYNHDISTSDQPTVNRYDLRDLKIDISHEHYNDYNDNLDGMVNNRKDDLGFDEQEDND